MMTILRCSLFGGGGLLSTSTFTRQSVAQTASNRLLHILTLEVTNNFFSWGVAIQQ